MAIYPELRGKVAVVTGGSTGIGEAVCYALARSGVAVAVNGRSNAEAAERVAAGVRALGAPAGAFLADVARAAEVERLFEATRRALGPVDILVNNAGGFRRFRGLVDLPEDEWDQVVDLNLKSVYLCSRAALPDMLARRWGRIVNVSSDMGRMPTRALGAHYTAAKAGVLGLTRHLALEVARHGITVNAVCPGTTRSDRIRARYDTPEKLAEVTGLIPLGRFAEPDEQAALIAFLCSGEAGYVTGATVDASGGRVML